jgi:hypothetical protein
VIEKHLIVVFGMALSAFSTTAIASEVDGAAQQRLRVHGDIAQHCAISSPNSLKLGSLERTGLQADLKFGLDCNIPFVMQIRAERGALTNHEFPKGQGPYAGSLPYFLDFAIPTRMPSGNLIRRSFNSQELAGGKSISSNGGIATEGMDVHLTLGQPSSAAGLLGGDYVETITISISEI